eukprot:TRINITY_DN4558_c0_g1_i18.p3 TRINITY_DN4558_c0_g1~~TRINITY_DN4558_c0_g1_i18.p3  ORF type:complete len:215 (+),score=56.26 TRINITY_DN4558_c0_g1_i18:92-736(+)
MSRAELAAKLDQQQFERLCWSQPMTLITPEGTTREIFSSLEIEPGVVYRTINGGTLQKRKDRIIFNREHTVSRSKQFSHIRLRSGSAREAPAHGGGLAPSGPPPGDADSSGSDAETLAHLTLRHAPRTPRASPRAGTPGEGAAQRGSIMRLLRNPAAGGAGGAAHGDPEGWADADVFGELEPGLVCDFSSRRDDIARAERSLRARAGPTRDGRG